MVVMKKKTEGKKCDTQILNTHICQHLRFLCFCCVDGAPSTHSQETQKLQHINAFTGGVQKNTSQLAQNRLVSVFISCCCLSWSHTVTPSQCTLRNHIHCYKSHIHESLHLHQGCSFSTIEMNNTFSKKLTVASPMSTSVCMNLTL